MIALVVAASLCGFALLCISNERHQRDVFGRKLEGRHATMAKVAAWCCLTLSYIVGIGLYGFGYGTLLSAGIATLTAAAVIGALNRLSSRR